jgi:hypothetical protein
VEHIANVRDLLARWQCAPRSPLAPASAFFPCKKSISISRFRNTAGGGQPSKYLRSCYTMRRFARAFGRWVFRSIEHFLAAAVFVAAAPLADFPPFDELAG